MEHSEDSIGTVDAIINNYKNEIRQSEDIVKYVNEMDLILKLKPQTNYNILTQYQRGKLIEEHNLNPVWSLEKRKQLA